MALLGETIVEEWFNRKGFFTIRGIKDSVDEIDILAIKKVDDVTWKYIHCEVQISIRPVSYISKLTKTLQSELNVKSVNSAKKRTDEQLESCVIQWIENKFRSKKKENIRKSLVGNACWIYMFVHGAVKDEKELNFIKENGVKLVPFEDIIDDLCNEKNLGFVASSAGDLIEIINFYKAKK